MRDIGYTAERGSNILSERFEGRSPEWQKEHEQAFERAQNEAKQHFHRCPNCNNCGENLQTAAAPPSGKCAACGFDNPPGTKFCGGCGNKLL